MGDVPRTAGLVLVITGWDYFREQMRFTCTFLASWNEETRNLICIFLLLPTSVLRPQAVGKTAQPGLKAYKTVGVTRSK